MEGKGCGLRQYPFICLMGLRKTKMSLTLEYPISRANRLRSYSLDKYVLLLIETELMLLDVNLSEI